MKQYIKMRWGQLFSLENKALNELEIIHKVVKDLDYVEFNQEKKKKSDYPFEEYVKETKEKIKQLV